MGAARVDGFLKLFMIPGMGHCGGGYGFSQFDTLSPLMEWVENGRAPETLEGTKFWYDTPSYGIQFTRNHCRFPYRNTHSGSGSGTDPKEWSCKLIDNWRDCGVDVMPRLCNADGSFGY